MLWEVCLLQIVLTECERTCVYHRLLALELPWDLHVLHIYISVYRGERDGGGGEYEGGGYIYTYIYIKGNLWF